MARFFRTLWARLIGSFTTRGFVRLVQTHLLSAAGDALVAVALAGSVFFSEDPNTARTKVALSLALTMAPFAVVAPFLGPVIEKVRGGRKLVLFIASTGRALTCLLMATSLDSVALYPLAFLSLVFSKTHAVVKSATIPEMVTDQQLLVKANSVLAVSAVVSSFFAGGIGYAFAAVIGEDWVLRAGALLFVVAAALSTEVGTGRRSVSTQQQDIVAEKRLRDTGVLHPAFVMAVLRASVGFLTFLIAFDLRREEASTAWFGFAISAGLIGTSLGNVVGPRLRGRMREETMLIVSAAVVGLFALVMTQFAGRIGSVVLAGVLGLMTAAAKLAFDALVQRDAPISIRAHAFARFEAAFQLVWVMGALLPVTLTISTALGYALLAIGLIGAATWYFYQPSRRAAPVSA